MRSRPHGLAVALAIALFSGCRTTSSGSVPDASAPAPAHAFEVPRWFPSLLPIDEYVGAAACRPCHEAAYAAWARSPVEGRVSAAASVAGDPAKARDSRAASNIAADYTRPVSPC